MALVSLACLLVSALAVGQLLPSAQGREKTRQEQGKAEAAGEEALPDFESDLDAQLWVMGGFSCSEKQSSKKAFCLRYGLPFERLKEAEALANQIAGLLKPLLLKAASASLENIQTHLSSPLKPRPPNAELKTQLRHCVLQGLVDHIASFQDPPRQTAAEANLGASAKKVRGGFKCAELPNQLASLSASSVLLRMRWVSPVQKPCGGASAQERRRRLQLAGERCGARRCFRPRPRLIAYTSMLHEGQPLLTDCFPITLEEISACDSPLIRHQWLQMPKPVYVLKEQWGWRELTEGSSAKARIECFGFSDMTRKGTAWWAGRVRCTRPLTWRCLRSNGPFPAELRKATNETAVCTVVSSGGNRRG